MPVQPEGGTHPSLLLLMAAMRLLGLAWTRLMLSKGYNPPGSSSCFLRQRSSQRCDTDIRSDAEGIDARSIADVVDRADAV